MSIQTPNIPSVPAEADPHVKRLADALRPWFASLSRVGGVMDEATVASLVRSNGLSAEQVQNMLDEAAYLTGDEVSAAIAAALSGLPTGDITPPPAPSGLVAAGGFNAVFLQWTTPAFSNLALTEIWRSTNSQFGTAVMVGTTGSSMYVDVPPVASVSVTYYYWVRHVSRANVPGPYSSMVQAATADDPAYILQLLAGELKESELHSTLTSRINLIDAPATGLVTKVGAIRTELDAAGGVYARIAAAESDVDSLQSGYTLLGNGVSAAEDAIATLQSQVADLTTSDFSTGSLYSAGDLVKYAGDVYICLQDITSTPAPLPTDADYWEKVGSYQSLADQVSANTSAISLHDSRITVTENGVSSAALRLDGLEANVYDEENGLEATSSAVTQLTSRVAATEDSLLSQSSAITSLQDSIEVAEAAIGARYTELLATADAVTALTNTVAYNSNEIISQSNLTTALANRVDAADAGIEATSAALQVLDSAVTLNSAEIVSQSSLITDLTSGLTLANGHIQLQADAVQALDTRVSITEIGIEAQASSYTQLESRLVTAETGIDSGARALEVLSTEVVQNGQDVSTVAEQLVSLNSDLTVLSTGIDSQASAVAGLTARADYLDGLVSVVSQDVVSLTADLNEASSAVSAAGTALSELAVTVAQTEQGLLSQSSDLTALTAEINLAATETAAQAGALQELSATVEQIGSDVALLAADRTELQSRLAENETTVLAQADALNEVITRVASTEDGLSAMAADTTQLSASLVSAVASFDNTTTVLASADAAMASNISTLSATVGGYSAAIATEQAVRTVATGPTFSTSVAYPIRSVVVYNNELYQCIVTQAGPGNWNATQWKKITTSLYGQYAVKVDVNGYVAGFGLANDGTTSEFIVNADTFAVGKPGATSAYPFVVSDNRVVIADAVIRSLSVDKLVAGGTPENPTLIGNALIGSISASKITAGTITAEVSMESPTITAGLLHSEDNKFVISLTNKYIFIDI